MSNQGEVPAGLELFGDLRPRKDDSRPEARAGEGLVPRLAMLHISPGPVDTYRDLYNFRGYEHIDDDLYAAEYSTDE